MLFQPFTSKIIIPCRYVLCTTGEPDFAECRRLCRVLNVGHSTKSSLPSARNSAKTGTRQSSLCRVPGTRRRRALGKEPLCRVPGTRQRTALGKDLTGVLAVTFAECPPLGTRQRGFAECQSWALGKVFFFASKLFLQPLHIKLKYILKFGTFLDLFAIYP